MPIARKPIARRWWRVAAIGGVAAATAAGLALTSAQSSSAASVPNHSNKTTTPIKHLVVLFEENVSFDHYFATYPQAANVDGTPFFGSPSTPGVNTLASAGLLTGNPNLVQPQRLSPAHAVTCDQNHNYTPEQNAEDGGAMDQFVQKVSTDSCSGMFGQPGLTMDYYDGNTVTAEWNYAQQYALSDNSWDTGFGPSTPGAINLVSGNTHGMQALNSTTGAPTTDSYVVADPNGSGVGTVINDPDPAFDDCADKDHTSTNNLGAMSGKNIGDVLNSHGVTWGWFQGGFAPSTPYAGSGTYAKCDTTHTNVGGASVVDYSPHHNPFEYYQSTANAHHTPPKNISEVGKAGPANHQYDLSWFDQAVTKNKLPAVSFVKAAEYQDGHASYSDPTDEQNFLIHTINELESSPEWSSTAVVIAYDDSDGWYDHVTPTIQNSSHSATNDAAICSSSLTPTLGGYQDRCGPSQRLPLLVISPYARTDFVAHNFTNQASIPQFIEDNWSTGRMGDSSFDATTGSLDSMFNFTTSNNKRVLLSSDGAVASVTPIKKGKATSAKPTVSKGTVKAV